MNASNFRLVGKLNRSETIERANVPPFYKDTQVMRNDIASFYKSLGENDDFPENAVKNKLFHYVYRESMVFVAFRTVLATIATFTFRGRPVASPNWRYWTLATGKCDLQFSDLKCDTAPSSLWSELVGTQ